MREKTRELLEKWTIEEKASLLSQIIWETTDTGKLGLPGFLLADGPSGLRKLKEYFDEDIYNTYPCICYPSASTYANSWNRELLYELGRHLGKEAKAEGIDVLLGPGVNIKRSPLGGRNFEYYSEDPYVTAELATEYIKGLQDMGTGACLKHFAVNNQETRRMSIDAEVDEETLHDLYLKAFEKPVKEGKPYMVMTAYNQINGEYCAEHSYILKQVLRQDWGYEGCVVTDCYAAHNLSIALKNGLNLQMPGETGKRLAERIRSYLETGTLTMEELNQAVAKTVDMAFALEENRRPQSYEKEMHHTFARICALESMVLLKNEDGILPLAETEKIAVIGEMAKKPRFQGGGSSHVNPYKLEAAFPYMEKIGGNCLYAAGYEGDCTTEALLTEAEETAGKAEKVIVFIGLPEKYESEGYDRTHLGLPEAHTRLLQRIYKVNRNLVVVLSCGAPVEMPWIGMARGLLAAYLPGEAGGSAIAELLYGRENPSGKLAETFPLRLEDTPCYLDFPGDSKTVHYREGMYTGYRYYDSRRMEVRFPFGFGLSYTKFIYDALKVEKAGENEFLVHVTVSNAGTRAGKEIVQVYVHDMDSDKRRPQKELKGFEKIYLKAGEQKTISIRLGWEAFAHYEKEMGRQVVRSGRFEIMCGASSRNICFRREVLVTGEVAGGGAVTKDTPLGDLVRVKEIDEKLGELLKAHPRSFEFYQFCKEEDPLRCSMGALMSFENLKRVDDTLLDENIDDILMKLRNGE